MRRFLPKGKTEIFGCSSIFLEKEQKKTKDNCTKSLGACLPRNKLTRAARAVGPEKLPVNLGARRPGDEGRRIGDGLSHERSHLRPAVAGALGLLRGEHGACAVGRRAGRLERVPRVVQRLDRALLHRRGHGHDARDRHAKRQQSAAPCIQQEGLVWLGVRARAR